MTGFEVASYPMSQDTYRTSKEGRSQAEASTAFGKLLDDPASQTEGRNETRRLGSGPISVGSLVPLGLLADMLAQNPALGTRLSELPEDEYQTYLQSQTDHIGHMESALESAYSQPVVPDPARYPALQTYANIVVNGQIVATVDNQGVYKSSNDIASKVSDLLPDNIEGGNGPDLAQARADIIAKALGGKVVKAETALSQQQFLSLPEYRHEWTVDYEAMLNDPAYQEIKQAQTQLDNVQKEREEYLARGA
ncbi:hypothetical protein [Agrobacterium larrymoorei]|uniref:Uncharacterized protein n=1 Tax=Agrobacterium larrymoorei TaxID=160699 RepID=A0AAF0KCV7_9HYPH|nr:hypothetical protein [Agrobacterium larrymoorei]WHA40510.1 hypothetical protein CFBP5477_011830 [Agrobacterium larrymoorei]